MENIKDLPETTVEDTLPKELYAARVTVPPFEYKFNLELNQPIQATPQ